MDEVISYFVAHNFVLNDDSIPAALSTTITSMRTKGFFPMIAWDYNLAFGGMGMGAMGVGWRPSSVNSHRSIPPFVSSGELSERPMVAWIFENDAYTQQYHEAFDDFYLPPILKAAILRSSSRKPLPHFPLCGEGPHRVLYL